jgi:hypothetical protein
MYRILLVLSADDAIVLAQHDASPENEGKNSHQNQFFALCVIETKTILQD